MIPHKLDALLKPASIALVGVSPKESSPGRVLFEMVTGSAYQGQVYLVNPGYDTIEQYHCYADLDALPEKVEHVVLAIANERLERGLSHAITHGARAATIFSSCYLENDSNPPLKQRLSHMARAAGIAICGGNGMGFYNIRDSLYAGMYPKEKPIPLGGISFIAQSGSAFSTLAHNGCRLKFNLCVSSGNEMVTTTADYMDWALNQDDTRVIGLFLEAVRHPQGFVAALKKSVDKKIPVVVLKIGKSPLSAKLAITHTGAIAGDHAAYEALFKRYGVIQVDDFDEMAATLMMFQSDRKAGPGALATIQESGGFCEMVADLAHDLGVDFADIEPATKELIQPHLDPGLIAGNPLDAWGTNNRFEERFQACLSILMNDPNVSVGFFFSNFRDGYYLSEAFYRVILAVSEDTQKPVAFANCYADISHDNLCQRTSAASLPFIDGAKEALLAVKHMFAYRDFHLRRNWQIESKPADSAIVAKWRQKLSGVENSSLTEFDALALLADFNIRVPQHDLVNCESDLLQAALLLEFPLVLKTAVRGIHHKSDSAGVAINIEREADLIFHYRDLANRLGAEVLVSQMVPKGTEVGLGIINDVQFGPMIIVAAGGVLIEVIAQRQIALAPLSRLQAEEMLAGLKINRLINGVRGQAAGNRQALIDTIVSLSEMAVALKDVISEIDINPVIVNRYDAIAVDALVVVGRK